MREGGDQAKADDPIKLEVLTAQDEEALVARGWSRPTGNRSGGSGN